MIGTVCIIVLMLSTALLGAALVLMHRKSTMSKEAVRAIDEELPELAQSAVDCYRKRSNGRMSAEYQDLSKYVDSL